MVVKVSCKSIEFPIFIVFTRSLLLSCEALDILLAEKDQLSSTYLPINIVLMDIEVCMTRL